MERFKSEDHAPQHASERQEQPWPLINAEENRFIENTGGAYQGFVERADGRREFEDVLVGHAAYYDPKRRAVIEVLVTTEAVNDEGGNEIEGPNAIRGFSTMVVTRSASGETLDGPFTVTFSPEDFSGKRQSISGLRGVAHAAHRDLLTKAPSLSPSELEKHLKALLAQEGWTPGEE